MCLVSIENWVKQKLISALTIKYPSQAGNEFQFLFYLQMNSRTHRQREREREIARRESTGGSPSQALASFIDPSSPPSQASTQTPITNPSSQPTPPSSLIHKHLRPTSSIANHAPTGIG